MLLAKLVHQSTSSGSIKMDSNGLRDRTNADRTDKTQASAEFPGFWLPLREPVTRPSSEPCSRTPAVRRAGRSGAVNLLPGYHLASPERFGDHFRDNRPGRHPSMPNRTSGAARDLKFGCHTCLRHSSYSVIRKNQDPSGPLGSTTTTGRSGAVAWAPPQTSPNSRRRTFAGSPTTAAALSSASSRARA